MTLKLLQSVIGTCSVAGKSKKLFTHSRLSRTVLTKREFCSKEGSDDPPKESEVEKLLKSSSPLRSSNVDDFWASSPYPEGTVFRDLEEAKDPHLVEDNSSKSIILFPGQGNQFVGMAKNLMQYPVALDLFKMANDILGYDLLKICLEGPEHVLDNTKYCQPATFICSLALLEKLKVERPWAISNCVATCGYSLGELTALVFAGCMNSEKGLNLVKVRAEAMAECCKNVQGGMLTVFVGPGSALSAGMTDAISHCKSLGIEDPHCIVASYLFPNCKVVAGNKEALDFLKSNAKKYGIKRFSQLPVAGAFHTPLMKPAAEPFIRKLEKIDLMNPIIKVFSNVTSKPYHTTKEILKFLPKQIYSPIKWHQTMQNVLHGDPAVPFVYECGPGSSLTAVAVKVNHLVAPTAFAIKL